MKLSDKEAIELYVNKHLNKHFTQVVNPHFVGFIPTSSSKSLQEAFQILESKDNVAAQSEKPPTVTLDNLTPAPKKGIASLFSLFGRRERLKKSPELKEIEKNKPTPGSGK